MPDLYLIAHVAGRAVAIESAAVESVVDIGDITPVPRAPATVRGLATLRSRVVTVIDTQVALGGNAEAKARRAVVTQVDGHHYAFLVDTLDDIAAFDLQPLAAGVALDGAWSEAGRGIVDRDGEPVLVIDLTALVPALTAA
ncbi:chemotaxis protein CheW [Sphingomonas baiyangensis]|uniref:Chemotaxis protein CheW n=1 Tax=Sphingomonas baiyangensis TaxID=2572576 RepID=A0A4U1L215_9SPHN|nr:chemotaxis protein CheW [Sphingomonas baiyangensis]TKD50901.1 chemotaxis protein CheW [Sphingomonas baiyangensis]